jgi:hypothetical protein
MRPAQPGGFASRQAPRTREVLLEDRLQDRTRIVIAGRTLSTRYVTLFRLAGTQALAEAAVASGGPA